MARFTIPGFHPARDDERDRAERCLLAENLALILANAKRILEDHAGFSASFRQRFCLLRTCAADRSRWREIGVGRSGSDQKSSLFGPRRTEIPRV